MALSHEIEICVCIPTFRRAAKLSALLCALGKQTIEHPISIIVGNNDKMSVTLYPELSSIRLPTFTEVFVAERGVSVVRNELVAKALQVKNAKWLAFIDDDQVPALNWLAELVSVARRYDADIVGGPVDQEPQSNSFWAAAATDTSYLPKLEGPVPTLNETGNLLLSTEFLRSLDRVPFSLEYGRTGGEDYEFFKYVRSKRAKIYWAPNAQVTEVIPSARITLHGMLWRQYSTSAYQANADYEYEGTLSVIKKILRNSATAPLAFIRTAVTSRRLDLPTGLLFRRLAGIAGYVAGLLGRKPPRYGELSLP